MNDRMIPPPAEQFMATRINARTISVPSIHATMVSHPEHIGEFILGAANELHASIADEAAVHA
jgi:hypothetical protein